MLMSRFKLFVLSVEAASIYVVFLALAVGAFILAQVLPTRPPWVDSDPSWFPPVVPSATAGFALFYLLVVLWVFGITVLGHQLVGRRLHMSWGTVPFIVSPATIWLILAQEAWFPGAHKVARGVFELPVLALLVSIASFLFYREARTARFTAWSCWVAAAVAATTWLHHGWVQTSW
ncbi:MAG: hypothetical protein AAF184_11735 [Pseudomonadota bacterium]